jgi:hypothetical protein
MTSEKEIRCPPTPKLLISVLSPKDFDHELTDTFEDIYKNWAVPQLGPTRAYLWAWAQVMRGAIKMICPIVLNVIYLIYHRRVE